MGSLICTARARTALLSVQTELTAMTANQNACAYGHELGSSYALHIAVIPIKITLPTPQMVTAIKAGASENLSGEGTRNGIGTWSQGCGSTPATAFDYLCDIKHVT